LNRVVPLGKITAIGTPSFVYNPMQSANTNNLCAVNSITLD